MDDRCDGDDGDCEPNQPSSESRANGGNPDGIIDLSEVLDCLTSTRRRRVLYYLQTTSIAELDEVATHVAAMEESVSPDVVPDERRERVKVDLVHSHLPRLAEAHLIEYDRRSNAIRYTDPPRLLQQVLKLLARLEDRGLS